MLTQFLLKVRDLGRPDSSTRALIAKTGIRVDSRSEIETLLDERSSDTVPEGFHGIHRIRASQPVALDLAVAHFR